MYAFNTIEEALEALKAGRMILAADDPDRENEGDLICAAQYADTAVLNFMAVHGKGRNMSICFFYLRAISVVIQ